MSEPSPRPAGVAASLWPEDRRDELIMKLARAAGLGRMTSPERFSVAYEELAPGLSTRTQALAPFFLRLDPAGEEGPALLAVVACGDGKVRLLGPEGTISAHPAAALAARVRAPAEARALPGLERLLDGRTLAAARAASVRQSLVGAALAGNPVLEGWRLRAPSGSLGEVFRRRGGPRRLALIALAYAAQLALFMLAWSMIGARAVAGRASPSDVLAWGGVLGALVVARLASSWAAGRMAIDGGRLFRERLVEGLLALDAEPLRAEGIGQLLGRVMETEAVQALALGGGLLSLSALFELGSGAVVLSLGVGGLGPLASLVGWLALATAMGWRVWRSLNAWSALRLALTHDLVERMVGQRTLVAQQPPELRHEEEERALAAYERAARVFDRRSAAFSMIVPRGWLLVGTLALLSTLRDSTAAAGSIAISLGGVLFLYGAFRRLAQASPALAMAAVAWRQARLLFGATAGIVVTDAATPDRVSDLDAPSGPVPLVAAKDLVFRYEGRTEPALAGCSFEIQRGARVLLEGPSGGGKSTLGALLAGMNAPESGELTLDGTPQRVLGLVNWRTRVGIVPQFHENHVFSATLAFNLLMGRSWPPRREDLAEAEAICAELDLGGLLARMPSGLEQLMGETGWQLSHGERGRIFIARALLQRLDLRVLDESFAALDPETLERVLPCVLRRAGTLVVIAHP